MTNNLSIFMKDTDATSVSLGFYYQYESTLNVWLNNYLTRSSAKIYCETEDDIKVVNETKGQLKFSQVKCYAKAFSLTSEAVIKSICNFFMLFKEYPDVELSFEFITNSGLTKNETVIRNWGGSKDKLSDSNLEKTLNEIQEILIKYFKSETKRITNNIEAKINTQLKKQKKLNEVLLNALRDELTYVNSKYEEAIEEIADKQFLMGFIKRINWKFYNEEPIMSVERLMDSNKDIIKKIIKTNNTVDLLHGRLLSEIHFRSGQKDISKRVIDNELLESIILESQEEMEKKVNSDLLVKIANMDREISNIQLEIKDIKKDQLALGKDSTKESFRNYCKDKIKFFYNNLYDENFSIFDIFVKPNFYAFKFQGDILVHESFILDHEDNEITYNEDILNHLSNSFNKNLILIHGDPGIGKSSLSKVLFEHVYTSEKENLYPFHLELKNINYDSNFRNTIYNELIDNLVGFNTNLKNINMLLILDGFDELHLLAEGGLRKFFKDLIQFSENFKNIKIVLTGRTAAFSEVADMIPMGTNITILKKFTNSKAREWLIKWGEFKDIPEKSLEELLEYKSFEESIVGFPLLLYLFCKMVEEDANISPKELFELEKWEFYKKMIDWTCATSKFIEKEDFNPLREIFSLRELSLIKRELNQNIALAMYHKNYFSIKKNEFSSRGLIPKIYHNKKGNKNILEIDDYNLINTFIVLNYMRPHKEQGFDIAFEFIHKSFYEFLVSEALIDKLSKLSSSAFDIESKASVFYETFGGFRITHEVENFLKPLLIEQPIKKLSEIQLCLYELYVGYILKLRFLNEHNNPILDSYFDKYPENASNKISIESNVLYNILTLISLMNSLSSERFVISDNDKNLRSLMNTLNTKLSLNMVNLNHFKFSDTRFLGDNLRELDVSNSAFTGCEFYRVDLALSNFDHTKLHNLKFTDSNVENGSFISSETSNVRFEDSIMINCSFSNGIIESTQFINSSIQLSTFEKSDFHKCVFDKILFDESDFFEAIIQEAQFNYCSLKKVNFEDSVVKKSNFKNCDLSYSNLKNADFSETNLSGSNLSFANLQGANFSNADLSSVDLRGADIKGAVFEGANVSGINFSEVYLYQDSLINCDFTNSNLSNSVFTALDLRKVLLRHTNLSGTNLSYSNIESIDFSNSILFRTNLKNTNLKGCSFTFSFIKETNFHEANLAFANFNECEILLTSFNNTDLFNSEFISSNISESDFRYSSMVETKLKASEIRDSNFEKTNKNLDKDQSLILVNNKNLID